MFRFLLLISVVIVLSGCGSALEPDFSATSPAFQAPSSSENLGQFQVFVDPLEGVFNMVPVSTTNEIGNALLLSQSQFLGENIPSSNLDLSGWSITDNFDQGNNSIFGLNIPVVNQDPGSMHLKGFTARFDQFTQSTVSMGHGATSPESGAYTVSYGDINHTTSIARYFSFSNNDASSYTFQVTFDATKSSTATTAHIAAMDQSIWNPGVPRSLLGASMNTPGPAVVSLNGTTITTFFTTDNAISFFVPAGLAGTNEYIKVNNGATELTGPYVYWTTLINADLVFPVAEGTRTGLTLFWRIWTSADGLDGSGCPPSSVDDAEIRRNETIHTTANSTRNLMKNNSISGSNLKLFIGVDMDDSNSLTTDDYYHYDSNVTLTANSENLLGAINLTTKLTGNCPN